MRRRQFIAIIGCATAAWSSKVHGQQPTMPVVGFLNGGSPDSYAQHVAALRQGLSDAGYIEGQNVAIEYRWAKGS
jgi:putative ABC transport system substrate-binding protein